MTPKGWRANRGHDYYVKLLAKGRRYRCKECARESAVVDAAHDLRELPHEPTCSRARLRRTLRLSIEPSAGAVNDGAAWLRLALPDEKSFRAAFRRHVSVREVEIDVDIDREGRWTFVALRGLRRD